jgi:hypothetical protein
MEGTNVIVSTPHISEVDPNSQSFRDALAQMGAVLQDVRPTFQPNAYSAHRHFPIGEDEVMFEELVMPGELAIDPLTRDEAAQRGLPSCWTFEHDGTPFALRYADQALHQGCGIDVTSAAFRGELAEFGRAFVAEGLHRTLELNLAGYLFPVGDGKLTFETTDVGTRHQRVTTGPMTNEIASGDWAKAACFRFDKSGEPAVSGVCSGGCP